MSSMMWIHIGTGGAYVRVKRDYIAVSASLFCGLVSAGMPSAAAASSPTLVKVACAVGGPNGLVAAINDANKKGDETLELASGCTYNLTKPDNTTDGGNGLPVLTARIALEGKGGTTIARSPSTALAFRIFEVADGATVAVTG